MPIFLRFTPDKKITSETEALAKEFSLFIVSSAFISHSGTRSRKVNNPDGSLHSIEIQIAGVTVTDAESHNLFETFVIQRGKSFRISFVLSGLVYSPMQPDDRLFLASKFKPHQSKYAELLSKIPNLSIPDEFCCPLSGDIMETPVYDIRSPGVRYDDKFFQYWIGINNPKLVPHTKMPHNENFLKIDFELQKRIADFVSKALENHNTQKLEIILKTFNLPISKEKDVLNKAVRRAAMGGTHEDLALLFSFGVNVNSQDDNPEKKLTALHWALSEKKFGNALILIYSGALINIKNAQGITALQLIENLTDQEEKKSLLQVCGVHKLLGSSAVSDTSALFYQDQQRQLDQQSARRVHANLEQFNRLLPPFQGRQQQQTSVVQQNGPTFFASTANADQPDQQTAASPMSAVQRAMSQMD